MPFVDHYATLGVLPSATEEQIRTAWKQKARELHPDRNKAPNASALFSEAKEAYDVIGDPARRSRYDAERAFGTQSHVGPPPAPEPAGSRWSHAEERRTKTREPDPAWWDDLFQRTTENIWRAPAADPWEKVVDYGMEQDILEDSYGRKFVYDRYGVPRIQRDGVRNGFRSRFRNGGKVG